MESNNCLRNNSNTRRENKKNFYEDRRLQKAFDQRENNLIIIRVLSARVGNEKKDIEEEGKTRNNNGTRII